LVHRIGFEQTDTTSLCILYGSGQELTGDPASAVRRRYNKADDRPNRLFVNGLHDWRLLQLCEVFSRTKRDPAYRRVPFVTDESGGWILQRQGLQFLSAACALSLTRSKRWCFAAVSVEHAPAATSNAAAFGVENRLEIGPAILGQWLNNYGHGFRRLTNERDFPVPSWPHCGDRQLSATMGSAKPHQLTRQGEVHGYSVRRH